MGTIKGKNEVLWRLCIRFVAVIACAMAFLAGVMIPVNVHHSDTVAAAPHHPTQPVEYLTTTLSSRSNG